MGAIFEFSNRVLEMPLTNAEKAKRYRTRWPERYKNTNKIANDKRRNLHRQQIYLLKSGPCIDCKQTFNPWQMDFDHRPTEEKLFAVASGISFNLNKLLEEIKKCDLVCANCHRDRTYRRYGGRP